MLRYKIHYAGDYQDEIIIEGESIEELRMIAYGECNRRNWDTRDCWSEDISK